MKYIRTKDGQIKGFNTYRDDIDLVAYLSQFVNYQGECAPIKQADTIEELCDEFVVETKYESKQLFKYITVVRNILENAEKSSYMNIYGAIWTDKGLIYVAKMNDKGELELL